MTCRKPSEWKVTSNPFGGKTWYGVYRIRDIDQIDHSGNREYSGGYFERRTDAEDLAELLNKEDTHERN